MCVGGVGGVYLCLYTLAPEYHPELVQKDSSVVLLTERPVAVPPGRPEAWVLPWPLRGLAGAELLFPTYDMFLTVVGYLQLVESLAEETYK